MKKLKMWSLVALLAFPLLVHAQTIKERLLYSNDFQDNSLTSGTVVKTNFSNEKLTITWTDVNLESGYVAKNDNGVTSKGALRFEKKPETAAVIFSKLANVTRVIIKGSTTGSNRGYGLYYSTDNGNTWILKGESLITGAGQADEILLNMENVMLKIMLPVGNKNYFYLHDIEIYGNVVSSAEQCTLSTNVTPANAGEIVSNPTGNEFDKGTQITLMANRNFGYKFLNWVDETGEILSTMNPYTFVLNSNLKITAVFESIPTYSLTMNVEGGANDYMVSASPAGEIIEGKRMYEEGTQVVVEALSNPVMTFTNWKTNETEQSLLLKMNEDKEVTAVYSAEDFIVGWDFYKAGNNGRVADFYSTVENEATTLTLVKADGITSGWLDKSYEVDKNGYEGKNGAVNWQSLNDKYYYQTCINAKEFTNIKVVSQMLYNFNAYETQKLEYSLNGTDFTPINTVKLAAPKTWTDVNGELPADADNQEKVYIRWIPDYTSNIVGAATEKDGTSITAIYITGVPKIIDDGIPPVLERTLPMENSINISSKGKIVLTFDEKVKMKEGVTAKLNEKTLQGEIAGKVITFPYANLDYSTDYTFTLPGNSVSDLTNNILEKEITIHFRTIEQPIVEKALYDRVVSTTDELLTAIEEGNNSTSGRFYIFLKEGTYDLGDRVLTPITGTISLIGENMDKTIIVNTTPIDPSTGKHIEGISSTATFLLRGKNIYMQDITLKNAYPYSQRGEAGRAVVIQDKGDKNVFKNVKMLSYQDTYYTNNNNMRSYLEDCEIHGVVDFICGGGDIFFNRALLYLEDRSGNVITAPAGTGRWGYVFNNCTIDGAPSTKGTYRLGRPWNNQPRAVYLNTIMKVIPAADGWTDMSKEILPALFAEYNSMTENGSPVDCTKRKTQFKQGEDGHLVSVSYNPVLSKAEASLYTVENVLGGDDAWQPTLLTEQAAIPFISSADNGITLSWESSKYVRCWAICMNGKVIDFVTDNVYTIPTGTTVGTKFTVRAANGMGGLSEPSNEYTITDGVSLANDLTSNITIKAEGQQISVNGIETPAEIQVYTMSGVLLHSISAEHDTKFSLAIGAYIIKVISGKQTKSVVVLTH